MPPPLPNQELLRSLGQVVRGLSILFWGLPAALVVCVQTSQVEYFRFFGILPPMVVTGILVYGLMLLTSFHKDEQIWIKAVERAIILGMLNVGLAPFLYWWSRVPGNTFFMLMTQLLAVSSLVFLLMINPVLCRLTAMLPDGMLRHETIIFTRINSVVLGGCLAVVLACLGLYHAGWHLLAVEPLQSLMFRWIQWIILFLVLVVLAMTMALIWKTKETIFNSVFGGGH